VGVFIEKGARSFMSTKEGLGVAAVRIASDPPIINTERSTQI